MEVCELRSLAEYESKYPSLAEWLGFPGKIPPPGELEFLNAMAHRTTWYPGAVGKNDFFFLTALVGILAPGRVLEIGTSTGFSAAIIAAALNRQHGKNSDAWVDTIDLNTQWFVDETKLSGFEIPTLFPDVAPMIRIHVPHDSSFVSTLAGPNELKIVFIDADHRHPRVLLDVLRVAPYVNANGWIVLHDIRLGSMGKEMKQAGEPTPFAMPYGAEWLFQQWPFRKINSGNIGAIQLPNDKRDLVPFALRLLSIPLEIEGKAADRARRAVYQSWTELI